MSKKGSKTENIFMDVEEAYSKTELFFEKNKKTVTIVVIAIAAVIGIYYAYQNWYLAPMEKEANGAMFMAEQYFEQDSLKKAINGFGQYKGFSEIASDYSGTSAANLAQYYLGISYLKQGDYQKAIDHLKEFSSDDVFLGSIAIGAQGDANLELKNTQKAAQLYVQAANRQRNNFTTPIYLMKAAQAFEALKQYDKAIEMYKDIQHNYQNTAQGRDVEKYIARDETAAK